LDSCLLISCLWIIPFLYEFISSFGYCHVSITKLWISSSLQGGHWPKNNNCYFFGLVSEPRRLSNLDDIFVKGTSVVVSPACLR
jgi:hypothetical protein